MSWRSTSCRDPNDLEQFLLEPADPLVVIGNVALRIESVTCDASRR